MSESKTGFGGQVRARKAKGGKSSNAPQASEGLQPAHCFGVEGRLRDAVGFIGDATSPLIVHFAGQHLVSYAAEKKRMEFFHRPKGVKEVLSMSVAPNRKVIALCERIAGDDKAQVSVYHSGTQRHLRSLNFSMKGEFQAACFSADAKLLVAYGGVEDDSHIVLWKWAVEKVVATARCSALVNRIAINPTDHTQITTCGPQHLRLWRTTMDPVLREVALLPNKREAENFVDHAWVRTAGADMTKTGESCLLAVTDVGFVHVFDNTVGDDGILLPESKLVMRCTPPELEGAPVRVETIVAFAKGFVVGGSRGFFAVYERTDDPKDPFLLIKSFMVGEEIISCIAVAPNDEDVVAYSAPSRLRSFFLNNIDNLDEGENHWKPVVSNGLHVDSVVGMDIAQQQPHMITASADKTIKLWDYLTWTCQMTHVLEEAPHSVAMHPSGFFVLIGFRERVRGYNVLMDSLKLFQPNQRDIQVKNCRAIAFSHGGQFFACGAGIKVMVYNTYTFEEVACFDGHVSIPVRHITWSIDDHWLVSCGDDGAVYTCSVDTGKRVEDLSFVYKPTQYVSAAIDKQKSCVMAAGADGYLRYTTVGGEEERLHTGDSLVTQILLDGANTKLYMGTESGHIRVYNWPPAANAAVAATPSAADAAVAGGKPTPGGGGGGAPNNSSGSSANTAVVTSKAGAGAGGTGAGAGAGAGVGGGSVELGEDGEPLPAYHSFPVHTAAITSLKMSDDGKYLFSSAADGSVFALNVMPDTAPGNSTGKADAKRKAAAAMAALVPDKRQFNLGVALVHQEVMEEKLADLAMMEKKLEEAKSTATYNLHLNDSEWQEKLAKQKEAMEEALTEERKRFDRLTQVHEAYLREHMEEKEQTEADHVRMIQEVENQYEHKLALELERYDSLSEQVESMRQECEILLDSAEQGHEAALRERDELLAQKEASFQQQLESMRKTQENNKREFDTIMADVEQEHEDEVARRKEQSRLQLAEESVLTAKAKNQLTVERNKRDAYKKKWNDSLKKESKLVQELAESKAHAARLNELLEHQGRVVEEQKQAIADKEKQILNLRAGNRTLDNFRFVLDHRINQLTQERGPITAHVDELEKHIRDMYEELVREFQEKKTADREMSNKDLKIEGLTNETAKLRASVREKERVIASFHADLERHVKHTEAKDLESAVKEMYRIFVKQERVTRQSRGASKTAEAVVADDSSGSGSGSGGGGGGKGQVVSNQQAMDAVAEVLRQKEYMQRHADGLKRKLRTRSKHMQSSNRARLVENTSLINECNELRKENQIQRLRIKQLESQRHSTGMNGSSSMSVPEDASVSRPGSADASSHGGMPRVGGGRRKKKNPMSATAPVLPSAGTSRTSSAASKIYKTRPPKSAGGNAITQLLNRSLGRSHSAELRIRPKSSQSRGSTSSLSQLSMPPSPQRGNLVHGTTKHMEEATAMRMRMGELMVQLDDNNREIAMQRREIKRLREQVRALATTSPISGERPMVAVHDNGDAASGASGGLGPVTG